MNNSQWTLLCVKLPRPSHENDSEKRGPARQTMSVVNPREVHNMYTPEEWRHLAEALHADEGRDL